jgi:hypothetical protein
LMRDYSNAWANVEPLYAERPRRAQMQMSECRGVGQCRAFRMKLLRARARLLSPLRDPNS